MPLLLVRDTWLSLNPVQLSIICIHLLSCSVRFVATYFINKEKKTALLDIQKKYSFIPNFLSILYVISTRLNVNCSACDIW